MKHLIVIVYNIILFNCYTQAKIAKIKFEAPKKIQTHENSYSNPYQNSDFGIYDPFGSLDASDSQSEESRLRQYLLRNYSTEIRPVTKASTLTYVKISLTIIQVMDLDEQNQVMVTNAQISLKWSDENLRWNPEEFNNQTRIVFSHNDIWTPDIVLFNSADVVYSNQRDFYLIEAQSNGSISWVFPDILKSYCSVDIRYFPFDRQNCTLEFQSWSRRQDEIIVVNDDHKPFVNHPYIHTEWKILNIDVISNEENNFVWLEYTLHLKRNHAFYVNHMIFPFAILSSLTLFVFWLPPDSGEKITLTITILLALTVFLQLIAEYTPKAAKSLPIIGLYFNVNLILVLMSVVLTIIVLNFHFRGPKKQSVPSWAKKYVIGHLGKLLGFHNETRPFKETKKILAKLNVLNVTEGITLSDQSKGFQNFNTNKADYMNPKELKIYSVYNQNNILKSKNYKIINSFDQTSATEKINEAFQLRNNGTENETFDKLSRVLFKTLKAFEPSKLNDTKLKFEILKEIVECQKLLLAEEIQKANNDKIKLDQIYDEWKVLAMITDRICFFFYLIAIISSSFIFFVREHILFNSY